MRIILVLMASSLISCGTDTTENRSEPDQSILETEEPDTITTLLCQKAEACNEEDCSEFERSLEFEVDTTLIVFLACYNFEPCEGEKHYFSEEQIANYASFNCGG